MNVADVVKSPSLGVFNKSVPSRAFSLNLASNAVGELRTHLLESLKLRILQVPIPPGIDSEHNVRVAVLFSGGLDCTVLARLAHDILPDDQHIDLINVAFENPRVVQAADNAARKKKSSGDTIKGPSSQVNDAAVSLVSSPYERCPDRETGRKAHAELQSICPRRKWRFVAVRSNEILISIVCSHNAGKCSVYRISDTSIRCHRTDSSS